MRRTRVVLPLLALCALATLPFPVVIAAPIMSADDDEPAPGFPDVSQPPVSPGSRAFDPSGPNLRGGTGGKPGVTAPFVAPPKGKAAEKPAPPQSRAEVLDDLFHRLSAADDGEEATGIASLIERIWLRSGSDTADLLMTRTVTAIGKGNLDLAIKLLDKIVVLQPDWAEAWNKRATLRFLQNDDPGSMDDISHVLVLEPRHFGALSGMGFILQRNGMKKDALALMRKAVAIYPHNAELQKVIDELAPEVEGRDL